MSAFAKIGRRRAVAAIGGGVLAAPAILRVTNAQGLRRIKFTLSWMPEGTYAFVYVAKAMGAWRKRGLDVDIARGYGSLPAAQAVSQGLFDFSTGNASAVVQLVAKGLPIITASEPQASALHTSPPVRIPPSVIMGT